MKKFLVLLAALALVFAFVACSDDDDGTPAASSSVSTTSSAGSSNSTASTTSSVASSAAPIYNVADPSTTAGSHTAGTATGLFISEYFEGESNDKYLEIYNGTGTAINTDRITIRKHNASKTPPQYVDTKDFILNDVNGYYAGTTVPTSLAAGAATVYYAGELSVANCPHVASVGYRTPPYDVAIASTQIINHNGDDAFQILLDGIVVDTFGPDPAGNDKIWFPSKLMVNQKLIRKADKGANDTPWASEDPDSAEWDVVSIMFVP